MLFDDCEICQAQRAAMAESREVTIEEFEAAMKVECGGRYPIVNARRKKRIQTFIDKPHPVMDAYYELMKSSQGSQALKKGMESFIVDDPDFYDPYMVVSDIELEAGNIKAYLRLIQEGFERAVSRIADARGD